MDDEEGSTPQLTNGLNAKLDRQIIEFSFQVNAEDEGKCYIVKNGKMSSTRCIICHLI